MKTLIYRAGPIGCVCGALAQVETIIRLRLFIMTVLTKDVVCDGYGKKDLKEFYMKNL